MADESQDAPAQDSPSAAQFPLSIPQDGQLAPPLQKLGEQFTSEVGKSWSQDILQTIQQHANMAHVANANSAAGEQFADNMKSVKDGLIGMVGGSTGDPSAAPLALQLAPKFIGPLLETTGLPPDQMQRAHDDITGEVQRGIASAAVMKAADYHAGMATGLIDQLKDYITPTMEADLRQYAATQHVARTLDNQATLEQAQKDQAQASQVAAMKFGSTLIDPRTEDAVRPQGFLQALVRNREISNPDDKKALFTTVANLQTKGDVHQSDPNAVSQALHDIVDPKTNVAHDDLAQRVGSDMRLVDAHMLQMMNLQRTPEGQANAKQLSDAIDMGRRTLAPSDSLAGNVAYSRFVNWLLPAYRRTGVGGLNPDSDSYLFKNTSIANFAPTARDAVPPLASRRQSLGDIFGGGRGNV